MVREILENQPNLWIFQQSCDDLIVEQDQVKGVVTQMGLRFFAESVVLTTGTFLGGLIHIGLQTIPVVAPVIHLRLPWPTACVNCRCASAA